MPVRRTLTALCLSLATVTGFALAIAPERAAHAQVEDAAQAEVLVLLASKQPGAGSIDPSIGNLPQLKKAPFDAYNTFRLLDKKSVALKKGATSEIPLADGRKLELVLIDKSGKPLRYRLAASITAPKGEAFLKRIEVSASPNEPFFVAGQSHQGGILVLGIALREK